MPANNYPFAYAYEDVRLPSWIDAHVRAFEYYGGVPKITISDNPKTAVITPDLVDPVLNKSYHEMAKHYGTTLIPARVYKPKDYAEDIIIPNKCLRCASYWPHGADCSG